MVLMIRNWINQLKFYKLNIQITSICISCVFCAHVLSAQQIEDTIGRTVLKRDARIDKMLSYSIDINEKEEFIDGYRIQITFGTSRNGIDRAKSIFYQHFPDMRCFIVYNQPYYKLRVGAYRTKMEASSYMSRIIEQYPEAFIVKDRFREDLISFR